MSVFPYFSNVDDNLITKLRNRRGKIQSISSLNAWVRVSSGVGAGLSIISNPNFSLLKAAGDTNNAALYGGADVSGVLGTTWGGGAVYSTTGQGYRPSPIIESLEIDEGAGNLSRKANFSITAHSKEQLDELVKYFLEPGYTIFLEWGWNTEASMGAWDSTLSGTSVAAYQSFKETQDKRVDGGYDYDNYLGYITGGGISQEGDKWKIEVKCTGFVELPAYLVTNEKGETPDGAAVAEPFSTAEQTAVEDDPKKLRFMKMFNYLPDARRTNRVKALKDEVSLYDLVNWDEDIASEFNSKTTGFWGQYLKNVVPDKLQKYLGDSGTVDGEEIDFPLGTQLVPENKFIKFGFLMKIINSIAVKYRLGGPNGKEIQLKIKTEGQPITAYENIFSADIEKLFVPNPQSPKFSFGQITTKGEKDTVGNTKVSVNSFVPSNVESINFPNQNELSTTIAGVLVEKSKNQWGYLDDLYVNFDFAKSVLDTKNFVLKDAMYQILNGLSAAVNGLWDFQIVELPESTDETTVLTVVDLNFTPKTDETKLVLDAIGANSIFIDSSFSMDMGGAMMNHIIGQRLQSGTNAATTQIPKTLFAIEPDQVLNNIEFLPAVSSEGSGDGTGDGTPEQTDAEKEKENLELFLGNLTLLPKVDIVDTDGVPKDGEIYDGMYLGAFKDTQLQTSLKVTKEAEDDDVSPLLPINFSFVIHGISGIKRGDKFKINGLPEKYKGGFFQVLSVKHTIDGMLWKTEVTGGYRNE